ncbi:hypothetical protein BCR43DRAFT_195763 [Syncephalastrum racemosum]|uniref:RRM domain-containing protein n=1 Tax=Syncephalastrum racemosum TaxID=13706 RepID=A0A1X2HIT9_SYNRA|nr:hypothetical protein BCR43DRAFT_195763 [Syncephalastrum racemosum]
MAQEGNHSMEGSHPPSNSGQQSNVVDDFLAALFASNPPAHASKQQNQQQKEKQEPPQQQQQQQQQQHKPAQTQQVFHQPQQPAQGSLPGTSFKAVTTKRNASPRPKETRFQNKKRDRDIDEFEEYEMLSKRKQKPAPKKKGNGSGSDYSRMGAGRAQVVSPSSFNSNTTATASMAATSTASTIATTNGHAPAVNPNHPRNRHGGSFGRTPIPNSRLYINGLPYAVKKPAIIEHFSQFGPVNDVYLKNTYGFVQFQRPESCSAALHGGKHFEGTVLDVALYFQYFLTSYNRFIDGSASSK